MLSTGAQFIDRDQRDFVFLSIQNGRTGGGNQTNDLTKTNRIQARLHDYPNEYQ